MKPNPILTASSIHSQTFSEHLLDFGPVLKTGVIKICELVKANSGKNRQIKRYL